jgi:hypothetical protein
MVTAALRVILDASQLSWWQFLEPIMDIEAYVALLRDNLLKAVAAPSIIAIAIAIAIAIRLKWLPHLTSPFSGIIPSPYDGHTRIVRAGFRSFAVTRLCLSDQIHSLFGKY